jgi:predicted secreted protein
MASQASQAELKKDLKKLADGMQAKLGFDPEAMMASITAMVNKSVKDTLKAKGLVQETGNDDDGSKYRDTPEVIRVHEVSGKGFVSRSELT